MEAAERAKSSEGLRSPPVTFYGLGYIMMLVILRSEPRPMTECMRYPGLEGVKLLCSTAGRNLDSGAAVCIPELATHQDQRLRTSDSQCT
jgi:hypothetical protein